MILWNHSYTVPSSSDLQYSSYYDTKFDILNSLQSPYSFKQIQRNQ